MEGQDWNPVVMRKHKPGGGAAKATPVNMNAVRGARDARGRRARTRARVQREGASAARSGLTQYGRPRITKGAPGRQRRAGEEMYVHRPPAPRASAARAERWR